MHRVLTVETWIKRFTKFCPIVSIEIEQVRFDMQKINNPEINGVQYQQGTLFGYEVREYLLEKWNRECAYCGKQDAQLEVEHIVAKSRGGSDRVSNLTLACHECNQLKGNQNLSDFLSDRGRIEKILKQAQTPLHDAAAVNSTRTRIVDMASKHCASVRTWTGGRTKMNRCKQELEKSHSIDAACVGESGENIKILTNQPLLVISKGHGTRQSRRTNDKGFPALITSKCKKTGKDIVQKNEDGTVKTISSKTEYTHISTGDIVRFEIKKTRNLKSNHPRAIDGKVIIKASCYTCRVKTPTKNGFEVLIKGGRVAVSSMKDVKFAYRADGYDYKFPSHIFTTF